MEPSTCSRGPRSGRAATITVAELLARYAGIPEPPPGPAGQAGAVSVAVLLRREGRGPHVADRPLLPRGHARVAQPPPEPPRRNVRKVAVAAGALFAATAVLGPSVVEDAANRSTPGKEPAIPLPLAGAPGVPGYGWSGRTPDEPLFAAMRQLFTDGIPSEVDDTALGDMTTVPTASGRHHAVRRPLTPGRASTGPTGPAVEPAPGTVPPGGAGTPPGGTWSWTYPLGAPVPPGGQHGGGAPGNGPGATGGGVTTPPVHVPAAGGDVPALSMIRTPAVTVGPGAVVPPAVGLTSAPGDVAVATTPTEVRTPDLTASSARVGPVATSGAAVTTPDVALSGAGAALSADAPPRVALPGVQVSETKIDPPDVALGPTEVDLPEIELPAVELPSVRLGKPDGEHTGDSDGGRDPVAGLGSEVTDTVTDTVGSLLGDEGAAAGETTDEETGSSGASAEDNGAQRSDRHHGDDGNTIGSDATDRAGDGRIGEDGDGSGGDSAENTGADNDSAGDQHSSDDVGDDSDAREGSADSGSADSGSADSGRHDTADHTGSSSDGGEDG